MNTTPRTPGQDGDALYGKRPTERLLEELAGPLRRIDGELHNITEEFYELVAFEDTKILAGRHDTLEEAQAHLERLVDIAEPGYYDGRLRIDHVVTGRRTVANIRRTYFV